MIQTPGKRQLYLTELISSFLPAGQPPPQDSQTEPHAESAPILIGKVLHNYKNNKYVFNQKFNFFGKSESVISYDQRSGGYCVADLTES